MQKIVGFFRTGWRDMGHSFIAGTFFSMPLSWAACTFLPKLSHWTHWLGAPWSNATLGVVISVTIYTLVFSRLSKRRLGDILVPLLTKEAFEMGLRWLIHFSLMFFFGLAAAIASISGQVLAGLLGHVATPAFVNRKRSTPTPP